MTTYRIRPLVWTSQDRCEDTNYYATVIGGEYCVEKYGYKESDGWATWFRHGDHYRPCAGRHETAEAARAACESHWRGVLSAALEPVEGA